MKALALMESQYRKIIPFKNDSYCRIDLVEVPVFPDNYSDKIIITTRNYYVCAHNTCEGTLSRIVSGLESRQTKSTNIILGDQFLGVLVLSIDNTQVAIELRERNEENTELCLIRLILTTEEICALQIEANRIAEFLVNKLPKKKGKMIHSKDKLIIDYNKKDTKTDLGELIFKSNRLYLRCENVTKDILKKAFKMIDNYQVDFQELKLGDISSGACFLWLHGPDVRLKIIKEVSENDTSDLFEISLSFHETKSLYLFLSDLLYHPNCSSGSEDLATLVKS